MRPARRSFLGFLLAAPVAAREAMRRKPRGIVIRATGRIGAAGAIKAGETVSYTLAHGNWGGQRKRIVFNGVALHTPGADRAAVAVVAGESIGTAEIQLGSDGKTWERTG